MLILAAAASLSTTASAQTRPIYKNAAQPIDVRVNDLLRRMTLEERSRRWKRSRLVRDANRLAAPGGDTAQYGAKGKRLSFGAITGAPRGTPRQRAEAINRLQKYFVEETRLGIPIIVTDEALARRRRPRIHELPVGARVLEHVGREPRQRSIHANRLEAALTGTNLVLAPVLDLAQDPRGGASRRPTAKIRI
jgi:beta-glucosidase